MNLTKTLAAVCMALLIPGCETGRTADEDATVAGDSKVVSDSKVVKPDGKVVKPDGKVVKPDGKVVKPDSKVVKPDSKVKPDIMIQPDISPAAVCPKSLPSAGGACKLQGLACQYGTDPRRKCRPVATCVYGKWQITTPKCTGLPPVKCPATLNDAKLKKCTPKDAYCAYKGDLICHCTNCVAYPIPNCSGDPIWRCDVPNTTKNCPAGKPNLGTPCLQTGKKCQYHCGFDGARECKGGAWYAASGTPCPISSRRAKKEIVYLSKNDGDAIARKLLKVKLATYRYRDPSNGQGRKLGFILEDVGRSYAGDPARGRVDIYGYTSMLLATVQAQQRTIMKLEKQIKALQKTVKKRR